MYLLACVPREIQKITDLDSYPRVRVNFISKQKSKSCYISLTQVHVSAK